MYDRILLGKKLTILQKNNNKKDRYCCQTEAQRSHFDYFFLQFFESNPGKEKFGTKKIEAARNLEKCLEQNRLSGGEIRGNDKNTMQHKIFAGSIFYVFLLHVLDKMSINDLSGAF